MIDNNVEKIIHLRNLTNSTVTEKTLENPARLQELRDDLEGKETWVSLDSLLEQDLDNALDSVQINTNLNSSIFPSPKLRMNIKSEEVVSRLRNNPTIKIESIGEQVKENTISILNEKC